MQLGRTLILLSFLEDSIPWSIWVLKFLCILSIATWMTYCYYRTVKISSQFPCCHSSNVDYGCSSIWDFWLIIDFFLLCFLKSIIEERKLFLSCTFCLTYISFSSFYLFHCLALDFGRSIFCWKNLLQVARDYVKLSIHKIGFSLAKRCWY